MRLPLSRPDQLAGIAAVVVLACSPDPGTGPGPGGAKCGDGRYTPGELCPRLEGNPDANAVASIYDLDEAAPVRSGEVSATNRGARIVRTRLELRLAPNATVAAVNAVLESASAVLIRMVEGLPGIVVAIPDPGGLDSLAAVIGRLEAAPAVDFVLRAVMPVPALLPDNVEPANASLIETIDHHLAVRAHAAWNAVVARQSNPLVVVLDYFGDGPVSDALIPRPSSGLPASDFSTAGLGDTGGHGYAMLGILGGSFGGEVSEGGLVTGIAPGSATYRVVDLVGTDSRTAHARVMALLRDRPGNVILSTSLGWPCGGDSPEGAVALNREAWTWMDDLRSLGLEGRLLHVTAADNTKADCRAEVDARRGSEYAAAALLDVYHPFDPDRVPEPKLTNVLVVENIIHHAGPPFAPYCLNVTSKHPGHVAAIGTEVWTLVDASGSAADRDGTSPATPQVAGLAALLWSIDPTMTVQHVKRAITETATPGVNPGQDDARCHRTGSQPVIDAYGAVLSLDGAAPPTPLNAPVRKAILDANGDGRFDAADLDEFLQRFVQDYRSAGNHGALAAPATRDWGRYDLNGDGFTGGAGTHSFDLDRVGSTKYGAPRLSAVTFVVEGTQVTYDEQRVTDLQILCWYAYSGLWQGTTAQRTARLDPVFCVAPSPGFDLTRATWGFYLVHFQSATFVATGQGGTGGTAAPFSAPSLRQPIAVTVAGNTFTVPIDLTFQGASRVVGTWTGTMHPATRALARLVVHEDFFDVTVSPAKPVGTIDFTVLDVPVSSAQSDRITWLVRGSSLCGRFEVFGFTIPAGAFGFFAGPSAVVNVTCDANSEFNLTLRVP